MNREEAIRIAQGLITDFKCESKTMVEFCNVVIKALEQEPCEDRIIGWKKDFKEYINALSIPRDDYKGIMEYIDELPVTPQPKTGRWIKHDTGHSIYYDCSLCGCVAPCTETADKILWKLSNYCPDCGAKMQEV